MNHTSLVCQYSVKVQVICSSITSVAVSETPITAAWVEPVINTQQRTRKGMNRAFMFSSPCLKWILTDYFAKKNAKSEPVFTPKIKIQAGESVYFARIENPGQQKGVACNTPYGSVKPTRSVRGNIPAPRVETSEKCT